MNDWLRDWKPARLGTVLPDGRVRCGLCPRGCTLKDGQRGWCGVRGAKDGQLVTFNWGKSVQATEETIETEAVYHWAPGAPILSMGNIGCMMRCTYCHNWKTSQAGLVEDHDVHRYTPEQVVEMAVARGIGILSWTYNDPVVWHEFVLETATLAKARGLRNLYKSAFFITPQAVEELLPVIDIFSLSIKSMDPAYYRKITGATLEPVLAATEQVFRAGKHLEVSNLMITDLSDRPEDAQAIARFVRDRLSPEVPLHFVRFHPDHLLRDTIRTPIDRLERAREAALAEGIRHVYLGNVHGSPYANSDCHGCGARLVTRYGTEARAVGLTADGACSACGRASGIRAVQSASAAATGLAPAADLAVQRHIWSGDVRALHIDARVADGQAGSVFFRTIGETAAEPWEQRTLRAGEPRRFMLGMAGAAARAVEVVASPGVTVALHEVLDRAHFPTGATK